MISQSSSKATVLLSHNKYCLRKMFIRLTFFLCIYFLAGKSTQATPTPSNELLSVIVVYRHGERTPVWSYPNDPYKYEDVFPDLEGQLTNRGKERHYELGQWFRKRYANFLSHKFSIQDIYVASTDVDRTFMSAASNLAGLYPPENDQVWNENIPWQPIPIHTAPQAVLNMLSGCPRFQKLWMETLSTGTYKSNDQKHATLYQYLSEKTGSSITDLMDLYNLRDTLFIESHSDLALPDWTFDVYPDQIQPIADTFYGSVGATPELAKLSSGPFLQNVIDHFQTVMDNTTPYHKFLMFSGHDSCLAAILSGLGAFKPHCPYFANTILFELRRKNGEYVVNIFYKDQEDISPVIVKGCVSNCKFKDFKWNLRNVAITQEEWAKQCKLPEGTAVAKNRFAIYSK